MKVWTEVNRLCDESVQGFLVFTPKELCIKAPTFFGFYSEGVMYKSVRQACGV